MARTRRSSGPLWRKEPRCTARPAPPRCWQRRPRRSSPAALLFLRYIAIHCYIHICSCLHFTSLGATDHWRTNRRAPPPALVHPLAHAHTPAACPQPATSHRTGVRYYARTGVRAARGIINFAARARNFSCSWFLPLFGRPFFSSCSRRVLPRQHARARTRTDDRRRTKRLVVRWRG